MQDLFDKTNCQTYSVKKRNEMNEYIQMKCKSVRKKTKIFFFFFWRTHIPMKVR